MIYWIISAHDYCSYCISQQQRTCGDQTTVFLCNFDFFKRKEKKIKLFDTHRIMNN